MLGPTEVTITRLVCTGCEALYMGNFHWGCRVAQMFIADAGLEPVTPKCCPILKAREAAK